MPVEDCPILDNHIHIRENGKGVEAAEEFSRAGGTHLVLVNLPTWNYGVSLTEKSDFKKPFNKCIEMAKKIEEETEVKTYPIVGVHPAELTKWRDAGKDLREVFELMKEGIKIAKEYVLDNKAIAIGEVGRPHYPVGKEVNELSNELLKFSFRCAKQASCPVQLHTEEMKKKGIKMLAEMIDEVGLDKSKVIKHFSNPAVDFFEKKEIVPSIVARKESLKSCLDKSNRFLMETDYLDDPNRPGAVLGPKNVPKKSKWLLKNNYATKEDLFKIHKELPERIYSMEINL